MRYKIIIEKKAEKFLSSRTVKERERLLAAINGLPEVGDIAKLQGTVSQYRLRVGGFRVIYTIKHQLLLINVIDIDTRGQVYK